MATKNEDGPWFSSGRGIFRRRDAGFQMATMVATANWQEDTARFVELLNKGEAYKSRTSKSR